MAEPSETAKSALSQLVATMRQKLEDDGFLSKMRCKMQAKMIELMKGDNDALVPKNQHTERSPHLVVLNQLIMEYFRWNGLTYSSQMFAKEAPNDNLEQTREDLEELVGPFENKNIPILLEIVENLMEKEEDEVEITETETTEPDTGNTTGTETETTDTEADNEAHSQANTDAETDPVTDEETDGDTGGDSDGDTDGTGTGTETEN